MALRKLEALLWVTSTRRPPRRPEAPCQLVPDRAMGDKRMQGLLFTLLIATLEKRNGFVETTRCCQNVVSHSDISLSSFHGIPLRPSSLAREQERWSALSPRSVCEGSSPPIAWGSTRSTHAVLRNKKGFPGQYGF